MKVAINTGSGEFALSAAAFKAYFKAKGYDVYMYAEKVDSVNDTSEYVKMKINDVRKVDYAFYVDYGSKIKLFGGVTYGYPVSFLFFEDERCDPDLIAVLEKLGVDKGSVMGLSKIQVVEVPDNVTWEIFCYEDGSECINILEEDNVNRPFVNKDNYIYMGENDINYCM